MIPLVSVLIPLYNNRLYIDEAIRSVLAQTYRNFEIIVVDDGSEDGGDKTAAGYPEVRLFRKEHSGISKTRNYALSKAQGDLITFLDSDDLWDPEFLEKQLAFMKEKKAVCVCCSYRYMDENSEPTGKIAPAKAEITERDMLVMNRVGCLTGLYDTSCFGKIYLKEELRSIRDDYAYWYDIVKLSDRIWGNPEVLASYRVLAGSTTGNKRKLIAKQYRFYRDYLHLPRAKSAINILIWGVSGILKFSSKR